MRLLAAIVLLLAACDQTPPDALVVRTVLVKSEKELAKHCPTDPLHGAQGLMGCSRGGVMTTPTSKTCTIYALEPRGFDDHRRLETIGHEYWHCRKGRVHG